MRGALYSAQRCAALALAAAVFVGCTSSARQAEVGGPPAASSAQRKAITVALPAELNALATDLGVFGALSRPTSYVHAFLHSYVTVRDDKDDASPQAAAELPSLEAGTWKLLDDGTMAVTWKLRRGIRWHDGTEFTSADIRFGWQVAADPATPLSGIRSVARFIDDVETPDPYTAVVRWRQPSQFGGEMARGQLDPLPRHVLEAAFNRDKESFVAQPYFTSTDVFVGAGPFRVVAWERGSHIVAEAFDGYFLGRPKLDRVTFRFMQDQRVVLSSLLAEAVDIAHTALGFEEATLVQQSWAGSGGGTVLMAPSNYRHILPQARSSEAQPADLLDQRVRKALMYALDRGQLVEAVFPGTNLVAHSIGAPGTPIGDAIERQLVRYPYDQARASGLLEEVGWRRGGDGILTKGGARFQIELRSQGLPEIDKVFAVMQQDYRRVGIDLVLLDLPGTQNPQDYAVYPGLVISGLPTNFPSFGARWHSRSIARAENRWAGSNSSGYSSPALDRALDAIDRSIQRDELLGHWSDAWRTMSDDVAVMSMYYFPQPTAVRKGLTGVLPSNPFGSPTWEVYRWDIQ